MPKKPKIDHPVRQVRTCLGHTQTSFAKRVGTSAISIQRVENGTLKLSAKLAHAIGEATVADPLSLLKGPGATALDQMGNPYTKDSLQFLKDVMPMTDNELRHLFHSLVRHLELLLIASNRAGMFKTYGVNDALQQAFQKVAQNFDLKQGIESFLIETGHLDKRRYRVSDLRKFPKYAQILGFKDKKSYMPDKLVEFTIPRGWIQNYRLIISPVLPHGADMKMRDAEYILDSERPIPAEIKEAMGNALYWEIKSFTLLPV